MNDVDPKDRIVRTRWDRIMGRDGMTVDQHRELRKVALGS